MSPPSGKAAPEAASSEWRQHRLLRAGLAPALAAVVARDRRYDMHKLLGLIDLGCEPDLAVRIVAPLDP